MSKFPSSNDLRLKRLELKLDKLVNTLSKKIPLESTEREETPLEKQEIEKVPRINIEKIPIQQNNRHEIMNNVNDSDEIVYVEEAKPVFEESQRTRNKTVKQNYDRVVELMQELDKFKNENFW